MPSQKRRSLIPSVEPCDRFSELGTWRTLAGRRFDDVFVRQLANYGRPGDLVLVMSVSGNSPNLVKAVEWANAKGLKTVALTGGKRGRLAEIAQQAIVIEDEHYGRVEDLHMTICHMLCYAFMELPELRAESGRV